MFLVVSSICSRPAHGEVVNDRQFGALAPAAFLRSVVIETDGFERDAGGV